MKAKTILLYGRTNAGKTALIGELAEHVFKTTGKITRLYTADRGGTATIQPYIDLGIIDAIALDKGDPWIFLHKSVRGHVRDGNGKWVLDEKRNANVGVFAFESLRAFAEELKNSMEAKVRAGASIGGGSNITFQVVSEGENLKISGGNMAMFGIAQSRVTEEVWESQNLNAEYVIWTSSVSKDEDANAAGKVLGPDVIGKALTTEVPRWFNLTYRVDVVPAQGQAKERHVIYLGNHVDAQAGNAAGLGNVRMPLDAPPLTTNVIEPASLVQALKLMDGGAEKARDVIMKRLGLKAPLNTNVTTNNR